jgi:hypothetical protein
MCWQRGKPELFSSLGIFGSKQASVACIALYSSVYRERKTGSDVPMWSLLDVISFQKNRPIGRIDSFTKLTAMSALYFP